MNSLIVNIDSLKMSNSGNNNQIKTPEEQLKSCLVMLQNASTDNEKMAALLLFTHLMKTKPSLAVNPDELFKAVDVKFLVRLLKSSSVPEGCPDTMFKSLALNILSSFTEGDVLFHPLLLSNLSSIVEVLSMARTAETFQIFDDSVIILLVFSRNVNGCEHLLKSNCMSIICKAIIQNPEDEKLFNILQGILFHLPQQSWTHNCSDLSEVLAFFSTQFVKNEDLLKFTACEKLLALLLSKHESQPSVNDNEIFPPKMKDEIRKGLSNILQARCKVEFKYTAIKLTKVMIELFGLEWTVVSTAEKSVLDMSNTKFLLLALSIIQTEVRLILESGQIDAKSDFIVSSYFIIEKTIEFLICEQVNPLSNDVIMKLHSSLKEIFDCVIQFLIGLDSQEAQTPFFQVPIVIATVRVLCVWLSEETNALTDKIAQVLPILLKWAKLCQTSTGEDNLPTIGSNPSNVLFHLLPSLCHLSADELFCSILVKEDCHVLLANLFKTLWQTQQVEKANYPSHLITLCNILLNFSILEVDLVKTSEEFGDILKCIMTAIPTMGDPNSTVLMAHFGLLGLILFRHRFKLNNPQLTAVQNEFILNSISFLKQVHLSVSMDKSIPHWDEISELWFLSLQNLVACAKTIEPVKKLILDSSWPKELKAWIKKSNDSSNNLLQDLKTALIPIASLK